MAIFVATTGFALVLLGSFLPWARVISIFGTISITATDGDGGLTMVLAVLGLLCIAISLTGRHWLTSPGLIVAVLALWVGLHDLFNIDSLADSDFASIETGAGLWLVVIGGALAVVGGLGSLPRRSLRGAVDRGPHDRGPTGKQAAYERLWFWTLVGLLLTLLAEIVG